MNDQYASTAATATLRVRRVAIDTYRENVAFLRRDCVLYCAEGFQALSKVAIAQLGLAPGAAVRVARFSENG